MQGPDISLGHNELSCCSWMLSCNCAMSSFSFAPLPHIIWVCAWSKNSQNLVSVGSRLWGTCISETAGWIFSIQSSIELFRLVVVQQYHHLLCPYGLAHGPKTCQIWYHWSPDFEEPIYLRNYWMDLLHLKFWRMVYMRPVAVQHHSHLPICPMQACPWTKNLYRIWHMGFPGGQNTYLVNCWRYFHCLFCGIV